MSFGHAPTPMSMSNRDEYFAEALHRERDAIMERLGYKRQPDGEWSEEDLDRLQCVCRRIQTHPPEQEQRIGDELGNILHFEGDNIAVEIGILS